MPEYMRSDITRKFAESRYSGPKLRKTSHAAITFRGSEYQAGIYLLLAQDLTGRAR